MKFEWDEAKNLINLKKHGLAFDAVHDFDWDQAIGRETQVSEYEVRLMFIGPLGLDIVTMVGTERDDNFRIITLRRATRAERRFWDQEIHGRT